MYRERVPAFRLVRMMVTAFLTVAIVVIGIQIIAVSCNSDSNPSDVDGNSLPAVSIHKDCDEIESKDGEGLDTAEFIAFADAGTREVICGTSEYAEIDYYELWTAPEEFNPDGSVISFDIAYDHIESVPILTLYYKTTELSEDETFAEILDVKMLQKFAGENGHLVILDWPLPPGAEVVFSLFDVREVGYEYTIEYWVE